jgi:undecaprenyl-diphosphatase
LFSILEFLKYIFLGIIQGLTEVMPISSSGHVTIAQEILQIHTDEGLLFLILVNLGSLIALIIHFRKRIGELISGFFRFAFVPSSREITREPYEYAWKLVVATIPAGIVGYFLMDSIDAIYLSNRILLVGVGLLVTATVLYIVREASFVNGRQTVEWKDAFTVGLAQMLGVLPGWSRNGITTASGLSRKMSMETALVFSLLLSIPLSLGSLLVYGYRIYRGGAAELGFDTGNFALYIYYAAAFLASIAATWIALKFIFQFFRRGKLVYFSLYLFGIGAIALIVGIVQAG